MKKIAFWKMAGAGNDFVVIDGRTDLSADLKKDFFKRVCTRGLSVGADGVIIISRSGAAEFRVKFYNSDGSVQRFCGNGSRCASRYAFLNGIGGPDLTFEADDGIHQASIRDETVSVSIGEVQKVSPPIAITAEKKKWKGRSIDVGVPHFVTEQDEMDCLDVGLFGRALRNHGKFHPVGTNVDFIRFEKDGSVKIRTYERGVEGETLSCGSGCSAAAIYALHVKHCSSPIVFHTRSSVDLKVIFKDGGGKARHLILEGDARIIFKGELHREALSGFTPFSGRLA